MQKTTTLVVWAGREYASTEHCVVTEADKGISVCSVIAGCYRNSVYRVDYVVETDAFWQTKRCVVESNVNGNLNKVILDRLGDNWKQNGELVKDLLGCTDVDIPLTPFTNTLPIRRLQLEPMKSSEISVVFIDVLLGKIASKRQRYQCVDALTYCYENVPNDFESVIKVDEQGLVVDYPDLFVRMAIRTARS